ncbi:MAG: glycosyltransferase, partial [Gammaproteobacteria bacterium]
MHFTEILSWASFFLWAMIIGLPWSPWRNREILNASPAEKPPLDEITVVIPARNEADVIQRTLEGLANQSANLRVILVDDHSEDETAARAAKTPLTHLRIVKGTDLPAGWSGKLWAQNQGLELVETATVLLLDADVYLDPEILGTLLEKKRIENLHFISLMARPSFRHFRDRALMPAFVYFFKLIYPFALANSRNPRFASAAGGCILLDTEIFQKIGGLQSIRNAIIDDCTLAKRVKAKGYRTWTGLTRNVHSQRPYESLSAIWNMVARTAFTQLRYSSALLGLCTVLMAILFLVPLSPLFFNGIESTVVAGLAF